MAGSDAIASEMRVVSIPYSALLDENTSILQDLEVGFGPDGLGIVAVSGVPSYSEMRKRLLVIAERLAGLSNEVKQELEDPASRYSFGWSHGKETLDSGQPDLLKGSFYANPICDIPTSDADLIKRYPSYCRPNLWPRNHLPELESAFKDLGRLIIDVGLLLAHHCDRYVSMRNTNGELKSVEEMLRRSPCHKGRLLHYFAPSISEWVDEKQSISSWCGWHSDHGSLTGLTCAMYMKDGKEVACPDEKAGLYVKTRNGKHFKIYNKLCQAPHQSHMREFFDISKVIVKENEIAYQLGEATEVLSGGLLHATPHCVKAANGEAAVGVVRNTFAVFMQPHWDEALKLREETSGNIDESSTAALSFGEFTERLLSKYYVS